LVTAGGQNSSDLHAYFDEMVARPDHWKSFSLRDHAQMLAYRISERRPLAVTYDPQNDTDPHRQDAAKVVIPAFDPMAFAELAVPIGPDDSAIVLTATDAALSGAMTNQRALKVGDEVMLVVRQPSSPIRNGTVNVVRGQHGTTAEAHASGVPVYPSTNSLLNILRLPMGTADGHTYLVTWDAFFTSSFLFAAHGNNIYKTFQLVSDNIWFEVRTPFNGGFRRNVPPGFDPTIHISAVDVRTYNRIGGTTTYVPVPQTPNQRGFAGPLVTDDAPVSPQVGHFIVHPNRWTRFWVLIDQRANDYDPVSLWVADEQQNAVKILDKIPLSVRPRNIEWFWLEYNSSTNPIVPGRQAMVSYVRNVVMLRDVANPTSVLQRPVGGIRVSSARGPAAPSRVWIQNNP
jgi:hypothetical protein